MGRAAEANDDVVRPDRTTLVAFATLVVMAGGNAVAIRVGNREIEPFWGAFWRFAATSLLFFLVAAATRAPMPRGRALGGTVWFGVLNFGASYALVYWALLTVPAARAQTVLASVPLLTFVLALAHRLERFRLDALIGAVIAGIGIAVIVGGGGSGGAPTGPLLGIVLSSACIAEAAVVAKRLGAVNATAVNAIGMAVGAATLLALSFGFGETRAAPRLAATWISIVYLVTIGSFVVFALYLFVLRRWTASAASYQFVLFPLVTFGLSALIDDERLTLSFAAGGALVLAGVYVGALRRRRRRPVAPPPAS